MACYASKKTREKEVLPFHPQEGSKDGGEESRKKNSSGKKSRSKKGGEVGEGSGKKSRSRESASVYQNPAAIRRTAG